MPVYNGAAYLERSLAPLTAARERGEVAEILVVDDGSTDGGPALCEQAGARILSSGGRRGPAGARNTGAKAASGDILLFVDADVVIHDDVPRRAQAALAAGEHAAVFGSYDADPAADGTVSLYKNLLHHYVHQRGSPRASTFWAGCGAVLRQAFWDAGGFDADRFPFPSIED
ncbi:MAG: glycosyltransferase family 2 protein, partial [Deltaproteobacteria bacterium]